MLFQNLIENTDLLTWILLGIFLVSFIIQSCYYLFTYSRISSHQSPGLTKQSIPVSVIICARNEGEKLAEFLPKVLKQDYKNFEVIVVNDASSDNTEEVLIELTSKSKHLRYTSIPVNEKFHHGKKLAVTVGIKSARHDNLLFTDADCYPVSDQWISSMVRNFKDDKSIVLGYGKYERRKGLLNILIRYETVFTAIQYFSFALKGRAYMGVGRNLAYRKELFFKNRGFASHYHILSGDDDLFINEVADRRNCAIEISEESHTASIPKSNMSEWFLQKQRHLKTGGHYKRGAKFRIGFELFSRILFYGSLITLCLISGEWLWYVLGFSGVLFIIKSVIFKLGMLRLNEKYLLLPSLLLEPIMPVILGIIRISGFFVSNRQTWN